MTLPLVEVGGEMVKNPFFAITAAVSTLLLCVMAVVGIIDKW